MKHRIVHGVCDKNRLTTLERLFQFGIAIEIHDKIPDRWIFITRHQSHFVALTREENRAAVETECFAELAGDGLQNINEMQRRADFLQNLHHGDQPVAFAGERVEVRLVASYEDPSIRILVVDLDRYPELKKAFESGETVFVADAMNDPMFQSVRDELHMRNVRSIIVVPIRWRQDTIGAIFLRTERDATPFSDADVRFCQVIADITAKALRNAHRFESLNRASAEQPKEQRRSELQRIALVAFLRRLLDRYAATEDHMWSETLLPKASDEELERLVGVALQVMDEEAKG